MSTRLKTFEAFAGYGSQRMQLKRSNIEHNNVGISEIDEHAIIAYAAIHCEDREICYPTTETMLTKLLAMNIGLDFKTNKTPWEKLLTKNKISKKEEERIKRIYKACTLSKNQGDISKIDPTQLSNINLFTYSFPCQDISMAGKQRGLGEGSGSRSSLLWECQKIIEAKKPKYLMMENVKNLVGKKHKPDFDRWLKVLEDLGYKNYWKVINAKHCGVPQNRERVFCISILGGGDFSFYDDFDSGIRLKDILEDDVDDKYYLSEDKTIKFTENLTNKRIVDKLPKGKELKIVGTTQNPEAMGTNFRSWCYSPEGLVGCLSATQYKEPTQIVEGCAIRGRNPKDPKSRVSGLPTKQMLEVNKNPDVSNCLTTVQKDSLVLEKPNYRIRKLTPRECFRLMGVSDSDIDKIQSTGISNSQQYKMAGNSIVVACMKFLDKLTMEE